MTTEKAQQLQTRMTRICVITLELAGAESKESERCERCVAVIGQVRNLPDEFTANCQSIIEAEKEFLRGMGESQLHANELPFETTGLELLDDVGGLFATAVLAEESRDRAALFDAAVSLTDALNLREWIVKTPSEMKAHEFTTPPRMMAGMRRKM